MSAVGFRRISLRLLDPPELAARAEFDEDLLAELIESIKENGLIEPIIVKPNGDRFEVVAGHRRMIACRYAGELEPECIVREFDGARAEATKVAENADRENVNPAHEARYFATLLERHCGDDVDQLCALVKRRRAYVENRLLLLRADPAILDGVESQIFALSVAIELMKVHDKPGLVNLLDYARNGATARMVRQARVDLEGFLARQAAAAAAGATPADAGAGLYKFTGPECFMCRGHENANMMELLHIHGYCRLAILEKLLATYYSEGSLTDATENKRR